MVINGFKEFISTNQIPNEGKILISVFTVFIFSSIGFILSWFIKLLRNKDVLKINKYNIKNYLIWVIGAMFFQFILISTKLINYNIFSFLLVSLIWDKLYQKLFNKLKDEELAKTDSIEND